MNAYVRFCTQLYRNVSYGLGALCLFLLVALFIQVLTRYVLQIGWAFNSYLIRNAFIWVATLGAAIAVRRWAHFRVDLLESSNRPSFRMAGLLIASFASIVGAAFLTITSIELIPLGLSKRDPSSGLPDILFFLALPTGGSLMLIFAVEQFLHVVVHKERPSEDNQEVGL